MVITCLQTGESKKSVEVLRLYAVVQTGGKQYKLAVGDIVKVEKLNVEAGDKVSLDQILMIKEEDGTTKVGNPLIEGAKVTATVIKQGKNKKIIVYKYKKRKNMRKKQGHRQAYTKLKIEKIEA